MKEEDRKVVVVGLDGATFDLIGPWVKMGKLENFAKIVKNGIHGNLTSAFPPITPTSWTSFMTGKNPGKHGILDFEILQKNSYRYEIVNASNIDGQTLWAILSRAGKKVGVVNVPITYPPEEVNGFLVCGFVLSPELSTYPPKLKMEILNKIQGYERLRKDSMLIQYIPGNDDIYMKKIDYAIEKEAELTFYLMKNYNWDFFMTMFYWGDQIQHFLWKHIDSNHPSYDPINSPKYQDAIFKYYKKIDSIIGEILEKIDTNTDVIIMSDHGFGPLYKIVYINHWLRTIGLLKLKEPKGANIIRYMHKFGLTRDQLLSLAGKSDFAKFFMRVLPISLQKFLYWSLPESKLRLLDIDYKRTKAFSSGYVGQIFINLKEKYPDGVVEPGEEYEEVRNFIIKRLYDLKDPETRERIVDHVFKKEELYLGPYLDQSADILFVMKDMTYITRGVTGGGISYDFGSNLNSFTGDPGFLSAWHRMNGIFIAMGPDIKKGESIENARIVDLTPTILHILDVPIPLDMDGRVLMEILNPMSHLARIEVRSKNPEVHKSERYIPTKNEEEEIKKRLKTLGYME